MLGEPLLFACQEKSTVLLCPSREALRYSSPMEAYPVLLVFRTFDGHGRGECVCVCIHMHAHVERRQGQTWFTKQEGGGREVPWTAPYPWEPCLMCYRHGVFSGHAVERQPKV